MRHLLLGLAGFALAAVAPAPARASDLTAAMTASVTGWMLFAVLLVALAAVGWLCRAGSAYLTERLHASRIARVMDVLASQADGIAGTLLAHPPAPGATLAVVRDAAIAQSVAYIRTNLPDTLHAIGVTDGVLATRLANYVAAALRPVGAGSPPDTSVAEAAAGTPVAAALPQS